jgi:uncharacterized Fe-S cluster-containing radical SAM superfamily protein
MSNTNKVHVKETANGYTFLNFFNSTEVYSRKGFDSKRKALNYAKKYGYTVYTEMPMNVAAVSIDN